MAIEEKTLDQIKPGARVKVSERIKEGDKQRISSFEGIVLTRKHGKEIGASYTLRATVAGVGVEKVIPLYSPNVTKIEITQAPRKKIKRSKLYYLRTRSGKETSKKIGIQ
ncbi:MAG: hypothetical protein A3H06_01730 [Candidatus Colwellbacteria bacterium RIFCSPLOWO2_12_FULL_44_13]|uniref:50S ribosomal protein L19 n=3 Tax=Candidatus Colwelliibacteriota TaxID=1817904 RepID=A0A1G1Z7L1_9BACT|nr:MAG: hypothetical protein A3F24_00390 [Candidatus Colwellbacteria bacterium RIFCSPHIGHO2_12_FULL_44_17]OGY60632.1 MAG: hypothetical protein A3I31_00945 [Candidatus Colwellbacteria bacterium RIFCSPLOWO2_02_FULL_44_20b]OGY61890.1 MAG: hypothetical protein A3H06_01730 [Candidatus Colwellbacteria bacterium RIFCSPLOWO2_12_FULL_44_13]